MRVVADIETDGLYDTVTQVWCISMIDIDTKEVFGYRPHEIEDALKVLSKCSLIVGHNWLAYDGQVLEKLHKFNFKGEVFDTLVASRTIYPDLMARDVVFREKLKVRGIGFPNELLGSHKLKAWGWRLGNRKTYYEDWTHFTEEMLEYNKQDCSTTLTLYEKMLEKHFSEKSLTCEHKLHQELLLQEKRGICFDTKAATELYGTIQAKRINIRETLEEVFPPKVTVMKTKTKTVPFNPGSRQEIGEALMGFGWKPKQFTTKGIPKINDDILDEVVEKLSKKVPEVAVLGEYLMLSKRVGQLATGKNAWLKVEKEGMMHGRVNHMGCVTSRCSHQNPNLGQVPAAHSPYGNECRALFHAPTGNALVGSDLSGIELRMLAHYLAKYDGGEYGDIVLNGDIHTANQMAAGLPTRDNAKTFIYAWLYGAGPGKIGSIIGKGEKEGKALIAKFLDSLPALKKLKAAVGDAAKRGYLIGLDGRAIPVRSAHSALNTLLQGGGAVVSKYWYLGVAEELRKQEDSYIALFVHDEVQTVIPSYLVESTKPIFQNVLTGVEADLSIRLPLSCEVKVGKTWFDTH